MQYELKYDPLRYAQQLSEGSELVALVVHLDGNGANECWVVCGDGRIHSGSSALSALC